MTNLDDRELGTVLAALWYWQGALDDADQSPIADLMMIATDGDVAALTGGEIDELCERINMPTASPRVVAIMEGGVIQSVECNGAMLEVHDYDIDGTEGGLVEDSDGAKYVKLLWQ